MYVFWGVIFIAKVMRLTRESMEEASDHVDWHSSNSVASAALLSGSFVTFPEIPRGHVLWMLTSM